MHAARFLRFARTQNVPEADMPESARRETLLMCWGLLSVRAGPVTPWQPAAAPWAANAPGRAVSAK